MQQNKEIKSVSIIGAGNLGWHLALALNAAGIEIRHILSRSLDKAGELAALVSAVPVTSTLEIDHFPDLVIICITDEELVTFAAHLDLKDTILVHTSGSTEMNILADSASSYGVFYPLQTFTRKLAMDYYAITFLIEGSSDDVESSLIQLADKISGSWYLLNSSSRRKMHMAAVFACNFSNHMYSIASKIIEEEGLERELLIPLLEQTFEKMTVLEPVAAQTGPAARDDHTVMESHLALLRDKPIEMEIYRLLSKNILKYRREHE